MKDIIHPVHLLACQGHLMQRAAQLLPAVLLMTQYLLHNPPILIMTDQLYGLIFIKEKDFAALSLMTGVLQCLNNNNCIIVWNTKIWVFFCYYYYYYYYCYRSILSVHGQDHWPGGGSAINVSHALHSSILPTNPSSLWAWSISSSTWPHPIFSSMDGILVSYKLKWVAFIKNVHTLGII